jgi:hypothetical protein
MDYKTRVNDVDKTDLAHRRTDTSNLRQLKP